MAKFKKISVVIEATQWLRNGDHPKDNCFLIKAKNGKEAFYSEGEVVRRFRRPDIAGNGICKKPNCGCPYNNHGWIDTLGGGHIVCPGDWIITGVKGEYYPCRPDIFKETYEGVK